MNTKTIILIGTIWLLALTFVVARMYNKNILYKEALGNETA